MSISYLKTPRFYILSSIFRITLTDLMVKRPHFMHVLVDLGGNRIMVAKCVRLYIIIREFI